jgi:hypothetical protein
MININPLDLAQSVCDPDMSADMVTFVLIPIYYNVYLLDLFSEIPNEFWPKL